MPPVGTVIGMATNAANEDQPRCPTCGERDSEDIGDDVRRCRNCTYVWIPVTPEGEGR